MTLMPGARVRAFKRILSANLPQSEIDRIYDNAHRLMVQIGDPGQPRRQGLLFGQIQSGKTNNMLMSAALASDAGYRLFVVLTTDNTWLYDQTLRRIVRAVPGLLTLGKEQWDMDADRIQSALRHSSVVLLCTKNTTNMSNLQSFIESHCSPELKPIIFDDEADQASLNTLVNRDTAELSGINQAIVDLREYFPNHVYVQVTATPQCLFLQGANTDFAPQFTVTFEPGEGYVGGESFFEVERARSPMRLFPDDEVDNITAEEAGEEQGWGDVPTGLRQALCSFFVAAGIKLVENAGTSFSCMCHVSHLKDPHRRIQALVNGFITQITQALLDEDSAFRTLVTEFLREAYDDIRMTKPECPEFSEVLQEITDNIVSTSIQLLISGGSGTSRIPTYDAPFNVLIGGNRLGRGVTIERLLVTYYGRTSKSPQIDTLLQHARMYGYRKNDMDVMRFYISSSLLDLFENVYHSERQLWNMVRMSNPSDMQAIVLSRSTHSLLRPTRSSVVYLDALAFYMPGTRYFPMHPIRKNVEVLNGMLEPYADMSRPMQVPIDFLLEILNLVEADNDAGGSWDDEAIRTCVRNMKEMFHNRGFLVVRLDRDISRGSRSMLSPNDVGVYDQTGPTLTMYRYTGGVDKGWDGNPLWVPNIRFPDGNRYFMFSIF